MPSAWNSTWLTFIFRFSCLAMARLLISASFSRLCFVSRCSRSRSVPGAELFSFRAKFVNPFLFHLQAYNFTGKETSPTSKPLTPSTVSFPFFKMLKVSFRKKSLRLPWLKLTSITRQTSSGSANRKIAQANRAYSSGYNHRAATPLLLHPFGFTRSTTSTSHSIINLQCYKIVKE